MASRSKSSSAKQKEETAALSGNSKHSIDRRIADYLAKKSLDKENSVGGLVGDMENELDVNRDAILSGLIDLASEKKVRIQVKTPFQKISSFALAPTSYWYWGGVIAAILSLGFVFATSGIALYARYALGGLLVLFLPGFSLIELLYAKKNELDDLTRFVLSIGLSLALVIITGLILNYTPFGIRLVPVAVSLSFVTILFLTIALKRKYSYYKLANDI